MAEAEKVAPQLNVDAAKSAKFTAKSAKFTKN